MNLPLRFVLVRPRSPGNVGAVARAMKNFGFRDLALVDPRLHREGDVPGTEPYFERESLKMAWHASDILESATFHPDLSSALAPCGLAFATAPQAYARIPSLSPEEAAERLAKACEPPPAIVFGSESSGLTLKEMAACAGVIVIPTHADYRDLNLAQSAVLMAYLVFRASGAAVLSHEPSTATAGEVDRVSELLVSLAQTSGFLKHGGEPVGRELEAFIHRAGLTRREAGLLSSLLRKIGHSMGER